MSHLDWTEALECIEKGMVPPHVKECQRCARLWDRAEAMVRALRPEGEPLRDPETLARRIQASHADARPRWLLRPRWAWAFSMVPLLQ